MSKNFIILCFAIIFSMLSTSYAKSNNVNPYVGFGLSRTAIDDVEDEEDYNIELNAGLKFNFNEKFFIAPEIYYNITNELIDISYNNSFYGNISEKLTNNYGAKLNLGFNINPQITTTFLVGLGFLEYKIDVSNYNSISIEEEAFLVGFGLGYKITQNSEFKFNYELQTAEIEGVDFDAHQLKVGLAYNF